MTRDDGECLAFGGIWTASDSYGVRTLTFSILTLPAEGKLAFVHDRMPLVLAPADWGMWLTTQSPAGLLRLPDPAYAAGIALRAVSNAVGDVRNDGPELIREVSLISPATGAEESSPTLF